MSGKTFKQAGGKLFDTENWGKTSMILMIIIAIIAIIMIVFYIIYLIKTYQFKSRAALNEVLDMATPKQIPSTSLPTANNSAEYSYSMWFYIKDVQVSQNHKMMLFRGAVDSSTDINSLTISGLANPVIFMDKATNKVYVSVATNKNTAAQSSSTATATATKTTINLDNLVPTHPRYRESGYITAQIDYLPIQRWVNLGLVVRQEHLTVYINSDVYSVRSVTDSASNNGRPVFAGSTGNLTMGHISAPNGFISSVRYWNYSVSQTELRSIFNRGPTPWSWWARWLWFGRLKFQSPIVFVKEDETN